MTVIHPGSWNIGNYRLPDFGISEAIQRVVSPQSSYTAQGGSNLFGSPQRAYAPAPMSIPMQSISSGNVLGTNTGGGTPSYIPSSSGSGAQGYINQINSQTSDFNSLIDQDYNNAMGYLSAQEQGLQGQAGVAQAQIGNEYNTVATQLGNEQATNLQGVQSNLQTAETQGTGALQSARDLFRQTQQSNIAQLSALGISSSSVSEALAERLGVETARRIASISGSLNDVRLNSAKEVTRVNNYFQEKKTNLEQAKSLELSKIQQALVQGLNQINAARNQAASDKAHARSSLLANAQNSINSIVQQAQQFEQSLQQWAVQKASAAQQLAQNPQLIQSFLGYGSMLQQQFNPSQFTTTPSLAMNANGQLSGSWSVKPKDEYSSYGIPSAATNGGMTWTP